MRPRAEPAPQGAGVPLLCGCGSGLDWMGCQAGTAAESRELEPRPNGRGVVVVLRPQPEVPAIVWCAKCWPWAPANAKKRKVKHGKRSPIR